MRKFIVSLAAAGAALAFATPASAQYYPQPAYGYGYGYAPRAYGYGYATGAIARSMEARLAGIRAQVRDLSMRGRISFSKARSLDSQARSLQRNIHARAWNGIDPRERYNLERSIARLEQRVQIAAMRGRHYGPRYARYARYRVY